MKFEKIADTKIINNQLQIEGDIFEQLATRAFSEMRCFFRTKHLKHWREIYDSPKSSEAEKEKMYINLLAAKEAKEKGIPYCQDTGTDTAYIFRGKSTYLKDTRGMADIIEDGAIKARQQNPFRNSTFIPTQKGEVNAGNNTPSEVHFFDHPQEHEIRGVFSNKGGGSGSKLWQFSCPPALLQDPKKLTSFLIQKIAKIGHSACPPYRLSIVLGGLSALQNMSFLTQMTVDEEAFMEDSRLKIIPKKNIEDEIYEKLKQSDMGAQGRGKFFLMPEGLTVIQAPRHAAHFFVGIGVACSAHRVQAFKINQKGVFIEKCCKTPEQFLPVRKVVKDSQKITINLSGEKETVLGQLRKIKAGTTFFVSGEILGARDKAHAQWGIDYQKNKQIPDYLKNYLAVTYVGPSDTPDGEIIGSFGPTTAGRMDEFASFLGENKVLPFSIAKGTRSDDFAKNCQKYGQMLAVMQGGPAAYLRKFVKKVTVIDFQTFGMEAVRLYEVEKLPVQMIVDSTGKDFYKSLSKTFLSIIN